MNRKARIPRQSILPQKEDDIFFTSGWMKQNRLHLIFWALIPIECINEVFAYFRSLTHFRLVQDLETSLVGANEIGYPVVLKVAATKVLRKTEMKRVKIDIQDVPAFKAAFKELQDHFLSTFAGEGLKF